MRPGTYVAVVLVAPINRLGNLPFMAFGLIRPMSVEVADQRAGIAALAPKGVEKERASASMSSFFMLKSVEIKGRGDIKGNSGGSCPIHC